MDYKPSGTHATPSPIRSAADFVVNVDEEDVTPRFKEWSTFRDSSFESLLSDDDRYFHHVPNAKSPPHRSSFEPPSPHILDNATHEKVKAIGTTRPVSANPMSRGKTLLVPAGLKRSNSNRSDNTSYSTEKCSGGSEPGTESSSISSFLRQDHRGFSDLCNLKPARKSRDAKLYGSSHEQDLPSKRGLSLQGRFQDILLYSGFGDPQDLGELATTHPSILFTKEGEESHHVHELKLPAKLRFGELGQAIHFVHC